MTICYGKSSQDNTSLKGWCYFSKETIREHLVKIPVIYVEEEEGGEGDGEE